MNGNSENSRIHICFSDGSRYQGEWKNGKRNGKGIEIYSNGNKYIGEFKDDRRHGHGTCIYSNGSIYDGEWKKGNRCGQGIESDANGDFYTGEFKDDWRHGKGILIFSNGKSVVTDWSSRVLSQKDVDELFLSIEENTLEIEDDHIVQMKNSKGELFSGTLNKVDWDEGQEKKIHDATNDQRELDEFFEDLASIEEDEEITNTLEEDVSDESQTTFGKLDKYFLKELDRLRELWDEKKT